MAVGRSSPGGELGEGAPPRGPRGLLRRPNSGLGGYGNGPMSGSRAVRRRAEAKDVKEKIAAMSAGTGRRAVSSSSPFTLSASLASISCTSASVFSVTS